MTARPVATFPAEAPVWAVHPACSAFPLMSHSELRELADDIKAHGLRHPVTRGAGGVLLDGRNRVLACALAGVPVTSVRFVGGRNQEEAWVISTNLRRRHLTTSQRAMVAARLLRATPNRETACPVCHREVVTEDIIGRPTPDALIPSHTPDAEPRLPPYSDGTCAGSLRTIEGARADVRAIPQGSQDQDADSPVANLPPDEGVEAETQAPHPPLLVLVTPQECAYRPEGDQPHHGAALRLACRECGSWCGDAHRPDCARTGALKRVVTAQECWDDDPVCDGCAASEGFAHAAGCPRLAPPKRREVLGEQLSVSGRSVQSAATVLDQGAPELIRAVEAGSVSVSLAAQLAQLPPHEQRAVVAAADPKVVRRAAKDVGREQRRPGDAYYTPDALAVACVSALRLGAGRVLEPSVGGGAFVRAMGGCHVTGIDTDPDATGLAECDRRHVADFLQWWDEPAKPYEAVVGNPPYKHAEAFVRRGLELVHPKRGVVAFLLRLGFLGSVERLRLWTDCFLAEVHVIAPRPSFTCDGQTDGSEYAWFVFRPGRPEPVNEFEPPATTRLYHLDWREPSKQAALPLESP